jgi:hypothetical protein
MSQVHEWPAASPEEAQKVVVKECGWPNTTKFEEHVAFGALVHKASIDGFARLTRQAFCLDQRETPRRSVFDFDIIQDLECVDFNLVLKNPNRFSSWDFCLPLFVRSKI